MLHHLHEPVATLRELDRVLKEDGYVVLSTIHPTSDWLRLGGSYFTDERVSETWRDGWQVNFRRAPLQAIAADFATAGFTIGTLAELQPAPSMERDYPDAYRKLNTEPGFIAFRLIKRPDSTTR